LKIQLKKILAVCTCTALIFTSGCSIVTVNSDRDANQVVAVVGDTEITKKEVLARYQSVADQYGITSATTGADDIIKQLKKSTLDSMIESEVIWQKAQEKDLEQQLSAEKKASLEKDYDTAIAYLQSEYVTQSATSTATTTATPDATASLSPSAQVDADAYIDARLAEFGFTRASYKKYLYTSEYSTMLQAQVEAEITDISEEDLKKAYDTELETQKTAFDKAEEPTATSTTASTSTTSYESYVEDGKVVVYVPSGLAYYKHILIKITDAAKAKIDAVDSENLTDDDKEAKVATLTEQAFAEIKSKADEALKKVKAGEDFDTLMAAYGEDPGMQSGTTKDTGYLVGLQSSYVDEFKNASLALANVGDTTELVKSEFGYHIIKKVSVLTPGTIPYEQVKDALKVQELATKKTEHWDSTLEDWKTELKVTVSYDKIY